MSAERLIDLIEERQLLPSRLVEKLREKVAQADQPMTAAALAKFLVQKKHLSSSQATDLVLETVSLPAGNSRISTMTAGPATARF